MERSNFKPVFGQRIILLNSGDCFWTALSSTHTRFKNGKADFWITLAPDSLGEDFKSSNNGWWIRNRGNNFRLPEFGYNMGRGHFYGKIEWTWRCRKCQEETPFESLDSKEVCRDCNHGPQERRIVPS